ncbi:MAG: T9SS type A sorting domain-containing protein [bacterium]|nr:T9SS type A sorting domain-containing protein [bacterium]
MYKHPLLVAVMFTLYGCFTAMAQTGPGGVGSAAINVLWLDANSGVYNNAGTTLASNGNDVQQWNDRSGNAKNASQSVTGVRPNYVTNVLNGFPVLRFTAATNDIILAAGVSTANVASVWAVASYASLPSSNPGILIGAPPGTGTNVAAGDKCIGMWASSGAGTQVWGRGIQSDNTTQNISQVTTLTGSTFYIINNIYRSSGINQFVNNTAAGNNAGHNGTLRSWADVSVGRQGNESWNGDIAEVIFYNTEVNSAQRIIVDNYLAAKYGRTLSSNDVYDKDNVGNGNYDYEVAGIGRVDASNVHNDAQGSGMVRILNPTGLGDNEFLMWGHDNALAQANNTSDVPSGVQHRFSRVWRVSEVNAAGAAVDVGNVDMRWDLSGLGAVTASDLRLLIDTDNDGIFANETAISGATSLGANIYQFAGVTALANNVRFTIGTINPFQTPLPVEMIYFKAELTKSESVRLSWATATEKNSDCFSVEKSPDGLTWEQVSTIKAAGWSSKLNKYEVVDEHPYQHKSYYHLKKIDLDGDISFSPVRVVDLKDNVNTVSVYPNPTSALISIEGGNLSIRDLQLLNSLGMEIGITTLCTQVNDNKIELNMQALEAGIYFMKLNATTIKIIRN